MPPRPELPAWNRNIAELRAVQATLATQVVLRDALPDLVRTLAGFDVGFEDDNRTTRAAAVLLDADTLQVIDTRVVRQPTRMPYIPGFLSFRELPALLDALDALPVVPDLVFVDGQGVAHPRGLGVASHFGVVSGLPTIGVAKSVLCGTHAVLGDAAGDTVPLLHDGHAIGTLLRSKARCKPLVVSAGQGLSQATALDWVRRTLRGYRLPEPTRLADRLASRRDGPQLLFGEP